MTQNKPLRIALTGRMRSGKSTIADYLWLTHGFAKVSFASSLKLTADRLFSHLYEPIYDGRAIREYRKPRALLQELGQKLREIDEDVWIKQAEQSMRVFENYRTTAGIVIDDLRQPNEYEWARANGFVIVRVIAPETDRIERAIELGDDFDIADLTHETESYIDTFEVDYEIVNDGSIEDLERKVGEIIAEIKVA